MRLYDLEIEDRDPEFFATLEEARKRARGAKGLRYCLQRVETVPLTKEVIINILNGMGGYVREREVIFDNLYSEK